MKYLSVAALCLLPGVLSAADPSRCDDIVPTDAVLKICGVAFTLNKTNERSSTCTASYTVEGFEGICPELVFSMNDRVNSQGRIMAPTTYSSSHSSDKNNGRMKEEISGIGEAAHYSEYDIHMAVIWHDGERYFQLDVQKGKGYGEDWTPACEQDQIVQIAELIDESL